jgi:hypothetical protein
VDKGLGAPGVAALKRAWRGGVVRRGTAWLKTTHPSLVILVLRLA